MIEINLVPDVKQELIKAQRVRSVVISGSIVAGIIAMAIVAVLSAYVFGVQSVRGALADDAIKSESTKLAGVEDLSKVLTIQNQLTKISQLNDQKKINSRVFDMLQVVIPPKPNDVQLSSLAIDASASTITLQGQAANRYEALDIFKKTIDGTVITYDGGEGEDPTEVKLATNISTTDLSYGEDSTGTKVLRFTISFTYPEELFSPTTTSLTFKITNQGNATDSYIGLPKSIFVERAADAEEEN